MLLMRPVTNPQNLELAIYRQVWWGFPSSKLWRYMFKNRKFHGTISMVKLKNAISKDTIISVAIYVTAILSDELE